MMIDYAIIAALIVVAFLVVTTIREKKSGKTKTCTGCPNYSNCRAHIGCANNPNNR